HTSSPATLRKHPITTPDAPQPPTETDTAHRALNSQPPVPRTMKATARPRKTSPAISDPQSVLRLVIPNLHVPDVRLGTYVDSRQIGPFLRGTENLFVMYAVPGKILPRSDEPAQPHTRVETYPGPFVQDQFGAAVDPNIQLQHLPGTEVSESAQIERPRTQGDSWIGLLGLGHGGRTPRLATHPDLGQIGHR